MGPYSAEFYSVEVAVDERETGLLTSRPSEFQSSSMVEHAAVNRGVVGSSPTSGANFKTAGIPVNPGPLACTSLTPRDFVPVL